VYQQAFGIHYAVIEGQGLDGLFEVVLGGDSFERIKTRPAAAAQMPARHWEQAQRAPLMIGDSSNDAQAGRAAGCPVVLVSYGYNHGQPVDNRRLPMVL
jgi:phosphoglycolate phosphatase